MLCIDVLPIKLGSLLAITEGMLKQKRERRRRKLNFIEGYL